MTKRTQRARPGAHYRWRIMAGAMLVLLSALIWSALSKPLNERIAIHRLLLNGVDVGVDFHGPTWLPLFLRLGRANYGVEARNLKFSAAMVRDIGLLHEISTLSLENIQFESVPFDAWGQLKCLRRIKIENSSESYRVLMAVAGITAIREVELNSVTVSSAHIDALAALPSLQKLTMDGAVFDDTAVSRLCSVHELMELSIKGSNVTDEMLRTLSTNCRIRSIDVSQTQVSDLGISTLFRIELLHRITVLGTKFTAESPDVVAEFCSRPEGSFTCGAVEWSKLRSSIAGEVRERIICGDCKE